MFVTRMYCTLWGVCGVSKNKGIGAVSGGSLRAPESTPMTVLKVHTALHGHPLVRAKSCNAHARSPHYDQAALVPS